MAGADPRAIPGHETRRCHPHPFQNGSSFQIFSHFLPTGLSTLDPCCKLCSQRANMTVVGPATATQNLQAQFRVQSGYRLAEGSRLFLFLHRPKRYGSFVIA